jgi:hypothetical protein
VSERQQRRTRLTPEQNWQIFLESRGRTPPTPRCAGAGDSLPGSAGDPRARQGRRHRCFRRGSGCPRGDAQMTELEWEVELTSKAPKRLSSRFHG